MFKRAEWLGGRSGGGTPGHAQVPGAGSDEGARRRGLGLSVAVHSAAILALALALGDSCPASAQTAFYQVEGGAALEGQPGTIIRQEPMSGAPERASAYRVLYRSVGLDGKPRAVSGVVIIPQGAPPPGGRPIVAWAHPTTGVVPSCAPSLASSLFDSIQGLKPMLEQGYVVTATDYPGLGTAGPHPYLIGDSEGRAVLDSVRAARAMPGAGTSNRFAVWGHSQGGQAALFTGLLAKAYAPDLDLVGVAAAAPATELGVLLNDDLGTVAGKNLTSMALWSWARLYDAPMDRVLTADAIPVVNRLAGECLESVVDLLERSETERPLEKHFLSVPSLADLQPWGNLLKENAPGLLPPQIPVFLAQGASDPIVRPAATQDYAARLCQGGSKVELFLMPGVGHVTAAQKSAGTAVDWIAARFAGRTPPSGCGG